MKSLLWSFAERVFPRASTAVIMLLLAAFISPAVVGIYTLAILALTLFQAATDNAIRQHAVISIRTPTGRNFLRTYQMITAASGTVFITLSLWVIYITADNDLKSQVLFLIPLITIPSISAYRVIAVAELQYHAKWKQLANMQFASAAISLSISIPILIGTKSLLATSIQATATEILFATLAVRASKRSSFVTEDSDTETAPLREFVHLSIYSTIAWLQSQTDRLLIGPIAGISQLGLYSVSTSISRSAGDAISTSTANVLRPTLLGTDISDSARMRHRSDTVLMKALPLAGAAGVATMLLSHFGLSVVLGPQWGTALDSAVIMTITIVPTLLSWSMTVTLLAAHRIKWAGPAKAIGILLAIPIAFAAIRSLELAATLAVLRELIVLMLLSSVAGKYAPRLSLATGAILMAALSALAFVLLRFF